MTKLHCRLKILMKHKPSFIETIAEKLGLIENLHPSFAAEELAADERAGRIVELSAAGEVG